MPQLRPAHELILHIGTALLLSLLMLALMARFGYPVRVDTLAAIAAVIFSVAVSVSLLRRTALYRRESHAREVAERELRKLSWAMEQSPICVLITDRALRIEYVNPRYCHLLNHSRHQLIGQTLAGIPVENMPEQRQQEIYSQLEDGLVWRGEIQLRGQDQRLHHTLTTVSPIFDPSGDPSHILVQHEDITDRITYREHLFQQANFDALTGLPNRALAMDRLAQAINSAERHGRSLTLMYLDLDRFKLVNDSLGHQQGDAVLIDVAGRLRSCVREEDTVARLGGDEFLLILVNQRREDDGSVVANKIVDALQHPLQLEQREVIVTASIGLTVFPADGATPAELFRNSETAMYIAKQQGLNTYHFYTPEMNRVAMERLTLESQLRQAIARNELSLHYQPILDLASGRAVAVEALLRWDNAELGHVAPDRFVPVAEETGLIIPIGQWLLSEACRQAAAWHEQGWPLRVAVNVSSRQFVGGHIVATVERSLAISGLPAELLELELTERLVLSDAPQTKMALHQLKRLGVRLVLDDFGTGYSSLSYLKRYPFDALKIDRSFIRDLDREPDTANLTRAIIAMGHSLGLEVIGEGIETPEQAAFLQRHGCRLAQGFLLGRPQAVIDLEPQLSELVNG